MSPEAARLQALVGGFARQRVLVIGDLMLDEFIWGKVSRISPEAPVPVVSVSSESCYPGGAANVARNVHELGAAAAVMGAAGEDAAGERLIALLRQTGIDTAGVLCDPGRPTTVKTRIIARQQQVVRVDRESNRPLAPRLDAAANEFLERAMPGVDAVIAADYGKGFLSQALADRIAESARRHGKILAVDPHPYTSIKWSGATAVKPNRLEAFLAADLPPSEPVLPVLKDEPLLEAGRRLARLWQPQYLLITLAEHGLLLIGSDGCPHHLPTEAQTVYDVSGAGDTAIAAFTLALAAGAEALEAARVANRASGIVVGKLGTATVSPAELQAGPA